MGRAARIPGRHVCEADLPAAETTTDRSRKITVNMLKHICLAIFQVFKQICLFPLTIANVVRQRQRQVVLDENEAERLDRIRNPSKYLGK